jgi:fructose-1,6-bisphosphatase/inositol monophosphatase family enzyme
MPPTAPSVACACAPAPASRTPPCWRPRTGKPASSAALIRRARLYRTWGDCFGYFALASGGADVMLDPSLAYWDVAAIVPVVEGAGGRLTSWSGGDPLAEPSLIATAGPLHDEVLRLLGTASSGASTD